MATAQIKRISKGTATITEESYIVPLADGRKTVLKMTKQQAEIEALKNINASKDIQINSLISATQELNENVKASQEAYQAKIDKLEKDNKKKFGVGLIAGYDAIHNEVSLGIGIYYSLIKF